jgi:hypothetical protein
MNVLLTCIYGISRSLADATTAIFMLLADVRCGAFDYCTLVRGINMI